jgi:protein-S-isoprenylcysteine O-methyltransferase Ste14
MQKLLPPHLFILCIITMCALHFIWPIYIYLHKPMAWLGIIPLIAGFALSGLGKRLFHQHATNVDTFGKPDVLVTEGIYRITRNPMYVGLLLALMGVALMLGSVSPLAIMIGFFVITDRWYIRVEERNLLETFGETYIAYHRRTRRWI